MDETEYLLETITRINNICNNVLYKSYDSNVAIKTIKYILSGGNDEIYITNESVSK